MSEIRFMIPNRKRKMSKVLVGTPHADVKNYCFDNYVKNVKSLTYPNYDILVVDNSKDNKNTKKFKKAGIPAVHIKRRNKSSREVMAQSHEYLRKAALDGGYDFLLHYESDLSSPINIIETLLSHQLPVVSAAYLINHGHKSHLMAQEIEEDAPGERKTISLDEGSDIHIIDGNLHEGFAFGLGMCLIHKDVLKQIEFRYEEGVDAHPDTFFANDLAQLKIKQYVDTSVLCKHDNRDWSFIKDK